MLRVLVERFGYNILNLISFSNRLKVLLGQ